MFRFPRGVKSVSNDPVFSNWVNFSSKNGNYKLLLKHIELLGLIFSLKIGS